MDKITVTNNVEEWLQFIIRENKIHLGMQINQIQPFAFDIAILDYKIPKIKSLPQQNTFASIPMLKYRFLSTYIIASITDCYYDYY